jgi:hypothetical protein
VLDILAIDTETRAVQRDRKTPHSLEDMQYAVVEKIHIFWRSNRVDACKYVVPNRRLLVARQNRKVKCMEYSIILCSAVPCKPGGPFEFGSERAKMPIVKE